MVMKSDCPQNEVRYLTTFPVVCVEIQYLGDEWDLLFIFFKGVFLPDISLEPLCSCQLDNGASM
jgi:hypothetical protein